MKKQVVNGREEEGLKCCALISPQLEESEAMRKRFGLDRCVRAASRRARRERF
jgi:hypothetical protein